VQIVVAIVHIGENMCWGGVTLWGGALHTPTLHDVVLYFLICICLFYYHLIHLTFYCFGKYRNLVFREWLFYKRLKTSSFNFSISLCYVENHCSPVGSIFFVRNQCEWWFCHEIDKWGDCKDSHILIGLFRRQITIGVSL